MKKTGAIAIIIYIVAVLICGCTNNKPYMPLSDVVVKLLEAEGLSNCHILTVPKYKNMETNVQIPEGISTSEAFDYGKETTIQGILEAPCEFEINEDELKQFNNDEYTIKRYLIIGCLGYIEYGDEPVDFFEYEDIYDAFITLENRVLSPYISLEYEN